MSAHWNAYPTLEDAAESCSRHILSLLETALSGEGEATLALSGGETPKPLFEYLSQVVFDWSRVHLFWVDERCVPPTDPQSNYRLAEEYLIRPRHIPDRNVHRIPGELPADKAARRYSEEIVEFFELERGQLPHFDAVHLGTGADAHVASLFPGELFIENREGIAAAVFVEKISEWRITLLPGVLLASQASLFLTAGKDKAEAVHNVFTAPYDPLKFPAQVISHHGRQVTWFLDHAAARLVD
jgi:6-phosphogluconolactonase